MKLIIAEKPNVAKELKEALEPGAQYVRAGGSGYYKGSKFIIACSLGHIVVQKLPKEIDEIYGNFSFDYLPLKIRPIPLRVGDSPSSLYYKTLRDVILNEKYDEIIVATDPDREGQGIYERIKTYMRGFPRGIQETRLWVKEWTAEGLREAFQSRGPNAAYKGLGDAAECRAYDDYMFGMNGTTACSARFHKLLSVGRVQTVVLWILVARENEIKNFVPEKYKALSLVVGSDEPGKTVTLRHKTEKRLTAQEAAELYGKLLALRSVQVSVSEKEVKEKPMKLAGQTDFLQVMNKKYGYDAEKTSALLQTLYQDKKLTTYPGTEAHEISESAAKQALQPLRNLVGKVSDEIDGLVQRVFDNKWTIAKHCVTNKELAHEAITPVFGSVSAEVIQGLTDAERNCYLEIIKRYLQAFYPPAVFHKTDVSVVAAGEQFGASGKVLVSEGYLAVMGKKQKAKDDEDEDGLLPRMTDGRRYPVVEIKNEDKVTKPPARYTEADLLDAMKHAGRFVDDKHYADILKSEEVEGIGTGRTRSAILEILKKRGYYTLVRKAIYPSQKGMELIGLLPDDILITSPVMTAMLEEDLKLVEEGKKSKEQHMNETDSKVQEMVEIIRNIQGSMSAYDSNAVLCKCPRCGADIVENPKAFSCAGRCGVVLFKDNKFFEKLGKRLTASTAKALFTKNEALLKGLTSQKTGKKYDAVVRADFSGDTVQFSVSLPEAVVLCRCPKCGGNIVESPKAFSCESKCGVTLWKDDRFFASIGKSMTKTYAKALLTQGEVLVKDVVAKKTGKPYALLVKAEFEGGRVKYSSSFPK